MRKSVKTFGITAALAVMIPFSAYAATVSGDTSASGGAKAAPIEESHRGFGAELFGKGEVGEEVLELLKLDKETYREKLKAGSTLAQIAEEQGVSRESLKAALTEAHDKKLEERKQKFADGLDALIDAQPRTGGHHSGKGADRIASADLTAIAGALGLTADELKAQLKEGKTIADVAADKGVDVQKLVDAQKAAIEKSVAEALQAGEITQEQADKKLAEAGERAERIVEGGFRHGGGERGHGAGKPAKPNAAADSSAE
ncbi:hypothetical protein B1A99_04005 [Cohnella sp. CIP 111063]|uniref:hypothetical protein n=1 Tax=unclassified Cohnella TaxID=2636738 RepID=UPI000B8C0CF1|nr:MULTISPECIES: hypothetical protein [unclassified Cohnella]OXS61781.1 hypothetical protein B1A99_04005 [Cohnella sp. CIP 111063]PRX74220.1 hypothetical protein B0G52_102245 [Cohnella sp. SGD-V74]